MSPDVAASVRARLLNQARGSGEQFERTLVRFAAERLLYRLGASAARNRCLLKGGGSAGSMRILSNDGPAGAWRPGGPWSHQQPTEAR